MYVEEPEACSVISQALKRGHARALKTIVVTALAALAGACAKELESAVAGDVMFGTVQRKVRQELAEYVDDTEFIDLLNLLSNWVHWMHRSCRVRCRWWVWVALED